METNKDSRRDQGGRKRNEGKDTGMWAMSGAMVRDRYASRYNLRDGEGASRGRGARVCGPCGKVRVRTGCAEEAILGLL